MRKVRADPDKKLLFAQGGALISDLDEAAAEYGLATGSVSADGVADVKLAERSTTPESVD
jgi:hypothetical protein